MKISRRHALAGGALAVPFLVPAPVRAQPAPLTIRIGTLPTEQALPYAYAVRAGLFERAGIRLEVSKIASSGAAVAAAVAGGALDIGISSMLSMVLGHARGLPFTIVAPSGVFVRDTDAGLIVPINSTLRTPADFVGKIISAAAVNDINALAMMAWLDQAGVDIKAVKFVEIPQLAAPAALEAGRIDGATISNPAFTMAVGTGKARFVANIYTAIAPRLLMVAWFSTYDWVRNNRVAAERFARVIADASNYVREHVPETVDDLVSFTGVDRALAAKMKRTLFTPNLVPAEIQPIIDVAAKYKVIEKGFPASEICADTAVR
jgi:NitT/TauT family transport system substrate-binding protein